MQTEAIKNIKIDKVTVWDSGQGNNTDGKSSTASFLSGLYKSVPPIQDMLNMAGMQLPEYLVKKEGDEPAKKAPESIAPETKVEVPDEKKKDK
jgi:flotillin